MDAFIATLNATVKALFAALIVLGMQLPCPCPALAEASNAASNAAPRTNATEADEGHGCCPGDDVTERTGESEPDAHVCGHCADDVFVSADVASLPERLLTPVVAFPLSTITATVIVRVPGRLVPDESLARGPPPSYFAQPGRLVRLRHQSLLC